MGRLQWSRWQGGHGAINAETLRMGMIELTVQQEPDGKWKGCLARGSITHFSDFDTKEDAQARCMEAAREFLHTAFDDLKKHEALAAVGKGRSGRG